MPRGKEMDKNEFSLKDWREYLQNTPDLSAEEKKQIKKKINDMEKANDEFWKKWQNSNLCKLARIQLQREGKAEKVKIGETFIYVTDTVETFLKAHEIIVKAQKKGININNGVVNE